VAATRLASVAMVAAKRNFMLGEVSICGVWNVLLEECGNGAESDMSFQDCFYPLSAPSESENLTASAPRHCQ